MKHATATRAAKPVHTPLGRISAKFQFNRGLLPEPAFYYSEQGLPLRGSGPWRNAICPFHQDTRPSLRIHLETGAFRCMVCGAHGGDLLAFHMQRHGLGFVEAAKALGTWEAN